MKYILTSVLVLGLIGSAQALQNRPPMTDAEASAAADAVMSTCKLPSNNRRQRLYSHQSIIRRTIQILVIKSRSMPLLNSNRI